MKRFERPMLQFLSRDHAELTQRRISPHTIRHSTAMHLLQSGVEGEEIHLRRPVCASLPDATASSFKFPLVASRNAFGHRSR